MANAGIIGTLLLSIVTQANTSGLSRTDRAIIHTTKNVARLRRETGMLSRFGRGMAGLLGIGYGVMGIKNMVNNYVEFEKQLGAIHSRFYALEKDEAKANKQFDFARKIAKDTAMDIKNVADSYSIFYSSAKRALGEGGAQEVYRNWTQVARVLHLSGAQYERVMYALREMSSKGQLYAQDLMIQMGTHVPDIRNIAETAIQSLGIKGVNSIQDFQKYTKDPKNKDAMSKFLIEMSRETKRRYATDAAIRKAMSQPDALQQNIKNMGFDFALAFSKYGGNKLTNTILQKIADWVYSIDAEQIGKNLGSIAEFMSGVVNHIDIIISMLKWIGLSILASKLGKWGGALGMGMMAKAGRLGVFMNTARAVNNKGLLGAYILKKLGLGSLSQLVARITTFGFKGFAKHIFSKGVFASLVKLLVQAIPGIGQFISIILWLPVIIDILRGIYTWVAKKLGDKDRINFLESFGGVERGKEFWKTIEEINKKGGRASDVEEALRKKGFTESQISAIKYEDNGKISIAINGLDMDKEALIKELQKLLDTNNNKKKEAIQKAGNPKTQYKGVFE